MQRILLIRHGECYMNLELADKIGGRSNASRLTPLGEAQSVALGRHLRATLCPPAAELRCFSSTARRALDTGRIVLEELGMDPAGLAASEALLEQDMGDWEGAPRADCYTPANLALIAADTHGFAAPGGESQLAVEERMMRHLLGAVLEAAPPGRAPALVVGHGMAFKCVLRPILGSDARMSRKIALHNTAITEIGWVAAGAGGGLQPGWHILSVNSTPHLAAQVGARP